MFPFEVFLAGIRHLMTSAGVFVISGGWAEQSQWDEVSLAIISIIGFGWSVSRKWARSKREGA